MTDTPTHPAYATTPLHQLAFILQQLADELLLGSLGVGLSHTRIMGTLHRTPAKSQRAIAAQLRQTEANVSRQLQLMKSEGLVSIERNKKDGRQRDVCLTTKGLNKKEQAERLLADQQGEVLKLLVGSGEVKEFISTTERLLVALSIESKHNKKIFGS